MLDEKHIQRANSEHDEGEAKKLVADLLDPVLGFVLIDGQGGHIADAALIQVAAGGVMDGMRFPPLVGGRQHDHAEDEADDAVGFERGGEGVVPAVVKEDEGADEEARGRDGEQECHPVGHAQAEEHENQ